MEEEKPYLKHRDAFKKQCIFQIAGNALGLLTVIFLIFIPCFQIVLKDDETGIVFGSYSFSLFDEIKLVLGSLGKSSSNPLSIILPMYQIFSLAVSVGAIGFMVFVCVKNILNLMNLDDYILFSYDDIKTRSDKRRVFSFGKFTASQLFFSGIMMEILYIVFAKIFSSIPSYGGEDTATDTVSYIALMNGVSGSIAVVIIFAVAAVAFVAYNGYLKRKIKAAVLKEDYCRVDPFGSVGKPDNADSSKSANGTDGPGSANGTDGTD